MISDFSTLIALELAQYISKKPTFKRDKTTGEYKKTGELDYLNWADCLYLLYLNGAQRVTFGNVRSGQDHPVFLIGGALPFVRVYVDIDGDRRELDYPVIDGSSDVSMDKLTQSDVHNATQRAFVKCVAINWGLGLTLWQKEERAAPSKEPEDDLSRHSVFAVKTRIERLITVKLQNGMEQSDMLSALKINAKQLDGIMKSFGNIDWLEKAIKAL